MEMPNKDRELGKTPTGQKQKNEGPVPSMVPRGLMIWFAVFALLMLVYQYYQKGQETVQSLKFNPDFVQMVEQKKVTECEIVEEISGAQFITGTLKDKDPATQKLKKFKVDVMVTDDMPKWLRENGVKFGFSRQSPYLWQIVSSVAPVLLLLGLLYFMFSRQMKAAAA